MVVARFNERHVFFTLNRHHIKPLFLPTPYSADFKPIERLRQHLKNHDLAGFLTKVGEDLADNLEASIRDLLGQPKELQSICRSHAK